MSDSDSDDATLQMALKISKEEFVRQESSLKSDTGDESKYVALLSFLLSKLAISFF